MKAALILLVTVLSLGPVSAQKADQKLEQAIRKIVAGFHGEVGVFVMHLPSGKIAQYHADTIFPTASMVKIPILVGIMDKIRKKELDYHQPLIYRDSLLYEGEDILGSFKQDERIELSKVLMLMLTTSDNTASLWLQSLAGSGSRINELLDSIGLTNTRINSRTPGREANRNQFGWGQSTPREMVLLMQKIAGAKIFEPHYTDRMIRLLGRNYWDEEGLSQIPPTVFVASKNGAVDQSRSETMLVMAPNGPYIWSVMTKNQADSSWLPNNEGWVLARKLSRTIWQHFEPKHTPKGVMREYDSAVVR